MLAHGCVGVNVSHIGTIESVMVIRALIVFCVCVLGLEAQNWDALKELKPGDSIRVTDSDRQSHKGAFVRVTDASITVRDRDNEIALERARARRVEVKSGIRRLRNILIGAGIGVAVGITIDQTAGKRFGNEGAWDASDRAISYGAPIALLAGIGALWPHYRTLYRMP
jgi:hypothetical protein